MKKAKSTPKAEPQPETPRAPRDREYPLMPMQAKVRSCAEYCFAAEVRENPNGQYAAGSEGDGTGN